MYDTAADAQAERASENRMKKEQHMQEETLNAEEKLLDQVQKEQSMASRRTQQNNPSSPTNSPVTNRFKMPKLGNLGQHGGTPFLLFFLICIVSNLFDYWYSLGLNTITILVDILTFIAAMLIYTEVEKKLLLIPLLLEIFYARFATIIASSLGLFSPLFVKLPFWFLFAILYLFLHWADEGFLSQKTKDIILVILIVVGVFFTFPHFEEIELQNTYFLQEQKQAYEGAFETIGDRAEESSTSIQKTIAEQVCRMGASWNSLLNKAPPPCMEEYASTDPQSQEEARDIPLLLDPQFRMQIQEPESVTVESPIYTYLTGYNKLDHDVVIDLACGLEQTERSHHIEGVISDPEIVVEKGSSFRKLIDCRFEESPDFKGSGSFYVEALAHRLEAFTLRTVLISTEKNIQSRISQDEQLLSLSANERIQEAFSSAIESYELRERTTDDYIIAVTKIGDELISTRDASPIVAVEKELGAEVAFKSGLVNNYDGPSSNEGEIVQVREISFDIPSFFTFTETNCGYQGETFFARLPLQSIRNGFGEQLYLEPCTLELSDPNQISSYQVEPYDFEVSTVYDYRIRMQTDATIDDLPGYYRGLQLISPLQGLSREQISKNEFPQYKYNSLIRHEYIEIPGSAGSDVVAVADGYIAKADTIGNYNSLCIEHGDPDDPGAKPLTRYAYLSDDFMRLGETLSGTTIEQGTVLGKMLPLSEIPGIEKRPLLGTDYDSLLRFYLGYGSCESPYWEDPQAILLPLIEQSSTQE